MAVTAKVGQTLQRLIARFSSTNDENNDAVETKMRRERGFGSVQTAATGTIEVTLIDNVIEQSTVTSASFHVLATVAAGANSRDMQLFYDDGVGGGNTSLSSLYDGTATAFTTGVRNSLTITAGVRIPAGSRVFMESTHNGTGAAIDAQITVNLAAE